MVRNARHIGDEDLKPFLNNVQLDERFMKQAPFTKRINVWELLEKHDLFGSNKHIPCITRRREMQNAPDVKRF